MIRVLVVDDDFMVAKVHAAFVERTPGFTVVGKAHSGDEALRAVTALQPDLVLLDVYLPDVTGLQLLRQLRGAGAHVEVLVVTAADDAESVKQAVRSGAAGYLIKPFRYEDLRARLEQIAARLRQLEQLARETGARQHEVDRVFGADAPQRPPASLPKGVALETLQLVERMLRAAGSAGLSASDCAQSTGMSRVSARRYLEHLAATGSAEVSATYGGTGRPERRFRMPGTGPARPAAPS